ncbi:hypothetical protein [Ornithinimicrobium sp. INDO-MA30-4]|uniref:hypothetical protein n=1 Tax=Ornithinimicrobium sp. INDO-MA30-4 TaxID=2908651 RepID=UPI001F2D8779|nr:hypothetical protein [Ornithinimicrobium sp. INDO-MA30-4]UJH71109.1 hypothetical protein L0A91_04365 [Ornithinimicrobium sp. INDO-MA30-4]
MSHRPRRTPGVVRIATKQIRADPVVSLLLAALVLILSLVATVGPRLLTDMNSRQVDYTFSDLSVLQRDVASTTIAPLAYLNVTSDGVEFSDADQTWARVNAGLERIRLDESEPLRTLLEPGRFYIDVDQLAVAPNDPDSDISQIRLQYRVDPALPQIATLVEGNWPVAHLPLNEFAVGGSDGAVLVTTDSEIEIALSQDAAEQLHWEVGEVRDVPGAAQTRLSGTYEPIDPLDTHWSHSPYAPELATFFDADRGTEATAAAYLAPNNPGVVRPGSTRTFKLWYPLDASNVPGDDVASLRAQLGGMTAGESVVIAEGEDPQEVSGNGVPPDGFIEAGMTARFTTELFEPLDALVAQQRTTTSLAAVVAAGPAGVALAVLAPGAQLIVTRRRPTLTLAEARGGSRGQVRGLLMAEGALIGLPAAAVGYLLAGIIIAPLTPWPWPALLVAGLIGACPMLALGLARTPGAQTQSRSDLGAAQGKYRVLVETIVLALAALAVWRLLDRGLVSQSSGFDPLVAATPALLALAFGVLTLRLLPVPLRVMTARLHAGGVSPVPRRGQGSA